MSGPWDLGSGGGSVAWADVTGKPAIISYAGSYTWSALQTAYPNGGAAFLALPLGTIAVVTGISDEPLLLTRGTTRWRIPDNTVVYANSADVVINTTSEAICVQWLCPAGLLGAKAILRVDADFGDSGTTTTYTGFIRCGTAGTSADAVIITGANIGWINATNRTSGIKQECELRSQTAMSRRGSARPSALDTMSDSNTNVRAADVTIPDASTNALYLTLSMQPNTTTDTLTVYSGTVTVVTCGD